jgi:hypothetical protein
LPETHSIARARPGFSGVPIACLSGDLVDQQRGNSLWQPCEPQRPRMNEAKSPMLGDEWLTRGGIESECAKFHQ